MRIERVVLGTWFPRTALHLEEVEQAFRGEPLPHAPRDLATRRRSFGTVRVRTEGGPFRRLRVSVKGANLSLTEDGILLLESANRPVATARKELTQLYEERVGPFIEALFRRGMPLPKQLADVRAALPFFIVTTGETTDEAKALSRAQEGRVVAAASLGPLTILPGRTTTVIHLPQRSAERGFPLSVEGIIQYSTFFREFESQLHTFLRLHRDVWESIDAIREAPHLRYRDLTHIRDRLGAQRKTIGFVRARVAQMGDVLRARSRVIHDENLEPALDALQLNRFDSLEGAEAYLAHLWEATDRYAEGIEQLLAQIYDENLRREVVILNIIVFGTLLTGFFGMNVPLPWEARWTAQWPSTLLVSLLLLILGVGGFLFLHAHILNRRFTIREVERGTHGRR